MWLPVPAGNVYGGLASGLRAGRVRARRGHVGSNVLMVARRTERPYPTFGQLLIVLTLLPAGWIQQVQIRKLVKTKILDMGCLEPEMRDIDLAVDIAVWLRCAFPAMIKNGQYFRFVNGRELRKYAAELDDLAARCGGAC